MVDGFGPAFAITPPKPIGHYEKTELEELGIFFFAHAPFNRPEVPARGFVCLLENRTDCSPCMRRDRAS